ncbi:MAG TPA: tripartite tricarboxylate transporter TctB family protein [Firmicutes bacterium]|jgi:putative tricarboxylic transport membrane protein|nr:tripartite tricarboxylate transporter TctB family protein [Bacillota bacterium]
MKKGDLIGGVISVLFGLVVVFEASKLPYWGAQGFGPGFVPLWSGVVIIVGGLLLFGAAWRMPADPPVTPDPAGKMRLLLTAGTVVVAALLMPYLGFAVSMFLLVAVLVRGLGKHSWLVVGISSFLTAAAVYLVFVRWLMVPLPAGMLGL